jgi:hypothetical protein
MINGVTTSFLYNGLNVVQELNGATPTANLLTRREIGDVAIIFIETNGVQQPENK